MTQAFDEIGYASYVYDLSAEQLQSALRRLDAMMATWNGRGIRLGYPLPASPSDSDLDEATDVPDSANEAVYANLAIRVAPSIGKTAGQELKTAAKLAYDQLLSRATFPPKMQFPGTMPAGAGNKPWRQDQPFLSEPSEGLDAGPDSELEFT